MTSDWPWQHFSANELRCKCSCGQVIVSDEFMAELERLRASFGRPMVVTSGCRCLAHNRAIRGHPRSLHICDEPQHMDQDGTLAVDIATPNGEFRGRLFSLAWQFGWSLGWGRGFLHLDRRDFVGLEQHSFSY